MLNDIIPTAEQVKERISEIYIAHGEEIPAPKNTERSCGIEVAPTKTTTPTLETTTQKQTLLRKALAFTGITH
ncbi:MAG: hypothetical protein GY804_14390 [Alphaproteobacteria bacterium]|nr:hypothetical protein [Alphaproteobacteria bacterium]